MPVLIAYVDESHDDDKFCLSAIVVRDSAWHNCLDQIRQHRLHLKEAYGIKLSHELHSYKLVRGKGRSFATRELSKWDRSRVFHSLLALVARLPQVMLFNVALDKSRHSDPQMTAWDRLTNRLERTARKFEETEIPRRQELLRKTEQKLDQADHDGIEKRLVAYIARVVIIADQGREREINGALRRMRRFNPIPSQYGNWSDGGSTKNIKVERIIEDPVFRESHRSYFVQLADAVAYALLKREVTPTEIIQKYGINKMFDECLSNVCYLPAAKSDKLGIVRK